MILIMFYMGMAALVINGIASVIVGYCNYKVVLHNKCVYLRTIKEQADYIDYLQTKFIEVHQEQRGKKQSKHGLKEELVYGWRSEGSDQSKETQREEVNHE